MGTLRCFRKVNNLSSFAFTYPLYMKLFGFKEHKVEHSLRLE